jgi:hypothetical protein
MSDQETERAADEREFPDAPLFALLRSIQLEVTTDRIDRIWIFPPRLLELGETAVVIVSAYPDADPGRRRVLAAHYTVAADALAPRLALDEFGTAPADRVARLVEDVLERIKDGPADSPQTARIEGDSTRWHELLHSLAERYLNDTLYPARPRGFTRPKLGHRSGKNRGSGGTVGGGHTTPA